MESLLKQKQSNCIKVVLYGPESTGKSTLAQALATYYDTNFVKEYSRVYAQQKLQNKQELTVEDVLPIAVGQMQFENLQAVKTQTILICDTDLLETKVYSELYYEGFCPDLVQKYAIKNHYDLYFLTYIDTPWEDDGLRDQPNNRLQWFSAFENALIETKKPYVVIKGDFETRLKTCITQIDKLLNKLQ